MVSNAAPALLNEIGRQPGLEVPQPPIAVEAQDVREVGRRHGGRLSVVFSDARTETTSGSSMTMQSATQIAAEEHTSCGFPRRVSASRAPPAYP